VRTRSPRPCGGRVISRWRDVDDDALCAVPASLSIRSVAQAIRVASRQRRPHDRNEAGPSSGSVLASRARVSSQRRSCIDCFAGAGDLVAQQDVRLLRYRPAGHRRRPLGKIQPIVTRVMRSPRKGREIPLAPSGDASTVCTGGRHRGSRWWHPGDSMTTNWPGGANGTQQLS